MDTKSKLQQIKEILFSSEAKETKLAEMKLEDGVTVLEAESFEAGQPVNVKAEDGQLIPLPVGEYKMEDGMILVVEEEGIIAAMKEAEAEAEPEAEEEVAASDKPTEAPLPKSIIETVAKETKFSSEDKEALETKIAELEAKITELTKEEETETVEETVELAKPLKHNPENTQPVRKGVKFAQNRTLTTKDRVMNKILNIKN